MKDTPGAYKFQYLSDPKNNRVVNEVLPPPHKPIEKSILFPPGSL
jgi:hypothetical protein